MNVRMKFWRTDRQEYLQWIRPERFSQRLREDRRWDQCPSGLLCRTLSNCLPAFYLVIRLLCIQLHHTASGSNWNYRRCSKFYRFLDDQLHLVSLREALEQYQPGRQFHRHSPTFQNLRANRIFCQFCYIAAIFMSKSITNDKEETVVEAVKKAGFEVLEVNHQGEWVSVTARKN